MGADDDTINYNMRNKGSDILILETELLIICNKAFLFLTIGTLTHNPNGLLVNSTEFTCL